MEAFTQVLLEEIILYEVFRWGLGFAVAIFVTLKLTTYCWKKYKEGKKKEP